MPHLRLQALNILLVFTSCCCSTYSLRVHTWVMAQTIEQAPPLFHNLVTNQIVSSVLVVKPVWPWYHGLQGNKNSSAVYTSRRMPRPPRLAASYSGTFFALAALTRLALSATVEGGKRTGSSVIICGQTWGREAKMWHHPCLLSL